MYGKCVFCKQTKAKKKLCCPCEICNNVAEYNQYKIAAPAIWIWHMALIFQLTVRPYCNLNMTIQQDYGSYITCWHQYHRCCLKEGAITACLHLH